MTTNQAEIIADPEMEATHYGIQVAHIGEDGDMLALGHHDTRRALAAFNRHARTFCDLINLADDRDACAEDWAGQIEHRMAVIRKPDVTNLYEDPAWRWVADWSDANAPGARPITVLEA
jgi:hypothetical protein